MPTDLDLLVLGPVAAHRDGVPIHLGGAGEHLLLAALIVSIGHVVSDDLLADVLWGDQPPRSAHNTLQSTVSRLRTHLETEIERVDDGYLLAVPAECVDAVRFERAIRSAEEADGAWTDVWTHTRTALSLWRGSPYGAFGDRDPFTLERIRLDELRILANEILLTAEIELGRHALAACSLEALVLEYPYRERMWHLLVAALARDGRRIEAVRACDRLEDVLAAVGLGASPATRHLRQRVLDDDPWVPTPPLRGIATAKPSLA
jgi:DNA-binding SARP family transcriptional activator